ncbi:hypothetical protein PR202_gb10930 [Eleusine coracana subsp. coracana]|uniref:CID domain-containing protein n=1 Tax=Eleusine coracana subsp. coracana TaxID=191504 RepID=A0AAV5EIW7_ELECO|nr:hypothetical protein PR202_gb10930 [Eleusine coracana subsp. coracana]
MVWSGTLVSSRAVWASNGPYALILPIKCDPGSTRNGPARLTACFLDPLDHRPQLWSRGSTRGLHLAPSLHARQLSRLPSVRRDPAAPLEDPLHAAAVSTSISSLSLATLCCRSIRLLRHASGSLRDAAVSSLTSGAEARVHNSVSGFNKQILVQKLAKLNSLQQSIETLAVDQAARNFPIHMMLCLTKGSFIALNSRKEGNGYIAEFMRVIPAALNVVFTNGDDFGRNVVKRLIGIWEDRRIFDTQSQSLRDEFFRRLKYLRSKLKNPGGELLEKVISSYKHMLSAPTDEDTAMRKCQTALSIFDNLNKAYENNSYLGNGNGSGFMEELKQQHNALRNSIEQLKMSESLKVTLISHLKEALNEQEFKMEQVRGQLQFNLVATLLIFIIDQAARSRYKKADQLCQELGVEVQSHQTSNQGLKKPSLSEIHVTVASDSVNTGSPQKGQSVTLYSDEGDGGEHNVETTNLSTKLAEGTASDEIRNDALSSRANGGNHVQEVEERPLGNKRQKMDEDTHISQPQSQPPPPPFPHPDTFQPPPPEYPPSPEPSPPPPSNSIPPQLSPLPLVTTLPPQLVPPLPPTAGTFVPFPAGPPGQMTGMPYGTFPSYTPVVNFPMSNMPPGFPGAPNPPPPFQGFGGAFYGAPYSTAPPPVDKKQE